MQEAVQGIWNYHVNYDLSIEQVERIARNCGSKSLKSAGSWYRFIKYHAGDRFLGFCVDNTAFLFGSFARKHFRLAELAVETSNQGKGYGRLMLEILFQECIARDIYAVTFRTSAFESARLWYEKMAQKKLV